MTHCFACRLRRKGRIPITPEQIAEVDKRLEEYRNNPDLGTTWEEVKARILSQNR
jgi:putative addiction module component (TIGR02574 family)